MLVLGSASMLSRRGIPDIDVAHTVHMADLSVLGAERYAPGVRPLPAFSARQR